MAVRLLSRVYLQCLSGYDVVALEAVPAFQFGDGHTVAVRNGREALAAAYLVNDEAAIGGLVLEHLDS